MLFGFGKTESQERALALIYWRLTTDNWPLMTKKPERALALIYWLLTTDNWPLMTKKPKR